MKLKKYSFGTWLQFVAFISSSIMVVFHVGFLIIRPSIPILLGIGLLGTVAMSSYVRIGESIKKKNQKNDKSDFILFLITFIVFTLFVIIVAILFFKELIK